MVACLGRAGLGHFSPQTSAVPIAQSPTNGSSSCRSLQANVAAPDAGIAT